MNRVFTRAIRFAAIIGCGFTSLGAQAPATSDEIVNLPPLIVEEKLRPLNWHYASLPGREVLSVCDPATTERFMRRDWQLEQWLHLLLPARFLVQFSVSEVQILFNAETGRAHAQEIIAEMARREGVGLAADGTVTALNAEPTGFGLPARRVHVLPNMHLSDRDVVRVFAIVSDDASDDFNFALDRVALLLRRRTPALPAWFIEGFVKLYEQTRFREAEFEFNPMAWTSPELTAALADDPEQPRVLLPMDELFFRPPAAKEAKNEDEKIWPAQAALFVRWALADGDDSRREQFWHWLDRLDQAPASESTFRECFGFGYSDARDRLSDYLRVAVRQRTKRSAAKLGRPPRIVVRAATDLEIARLRGDWERLQAHYVRVNYPELAERYSAQARGTLRRAYERGERDPQLLAILGLLECDEDKATAGRTYLEEAVRQNAFRPRVGFELARLRFREFENGDRDHRFTEVETKTILGPLMHAAQEAPSLLEIYTLVEEVWLRSVILPDRNDLALLEDGVRNFPEVTGLVLIAVQLHVNAGAVTKANELAERGRLFASDVNIQELFEHICQRLAAIGH